MTENKNLIIAIVVGIIALIIGLSTVIGFNSKGQYQGLIKRIETQTDEMKNTNPLSDSIPAILDDYFKIYNENKIPRL